MPGFFISNRSFVPSSCSASMDNIVCEKIENDCFSIYRCTLPKFLNDKLFCEDDDIIAVLEGVIVNSSTLCNGSSLFEYVKSGFLSGKRFYEEFRGNFAGAIYNKRKSEWEVFTDFLGMKPVFYYCSGDDWVIASSITDIIGVLRDHHIEYSLNTEAAYDLLTYGFMIGENTLVKEIKKLPYGCYMKITDQGMNIGRYYDFTYHQDGGNSPLSDEQIVERLDELFRQAVQLQFEKDKEYGYKHLATLSGGLDSRMTVWTADVLGYHDMLNLTFGESDCYDEKIAKAVAKKLGHSMIIRTLDDGKMLSLYKEVVRLNGGASLYSGIAHSLTALTSIDCRQFGLLHTGDIGDAIVGVFSHGEKNCCPGAYSLKLENCVSHKWDKSMNIEKFKMVTRGFNGVGASKIVCENHIDCMSPFLNRDFFEFCLKEIPYNKRKDHYIYKKWVLSKYPDAAEIPLQRYNGGRITEGAIRQTIRKIRRIGLKTAVEWALWKVGIKRELSRRIVRTSMNPLDEWYEHNKALAADLDAYASKIIDQAFKGPGIDRELIEKTKELYDTGNTGEKTQAITLLSFIEDWFLALQN